MAGIEPRRRCIGCGRVAAKGELLRIAAVPRDGEARGSATLAVADPAATLPGRGAYLCRDGDGVHVAADCVARAIRRDAFSRALRARVTLDPKIVESVGP